MTLTDYMESILCHKVQVETREGVIRTGTLTGVRTHDVQADGETIHFPNELILDGDETDPLPVRQLVKIQTTG